MTNISNEKHEDVISSKFIKLQEAIIEYDGLGYDDKKEYMKILTQWYMRQKDLMAYYQNHIK
jgi:hypothetical protein